MRGSRRRILGGGTRAVLMSGETVPKHSGASAGIWAARFRTSLGPCDWLDDGTGSGRDPGLLDRLDRSIHRRHDSLWQTAGPWSERSRSHEELQDGSRRLTQLLLVTDAGRRGQLRRLEFPEEQIAALSGLHIHNFIWRRLNRYGVNDLDHPAVSEGVEVWMGTG